MNLTQAALDAPPDGVRSFFAQWGGSDRFLLVLYVPWSHPTLPEYWAKRANVLTLWTANMGWGDRQTSVVEALAKQIGVKFAWPISTTYFGGREGADSMAEGLGVSRFSDQWRNAITQNAPIAYIQTWNDFSEDHAITDSLYRGRTLIELNRYFADWFKTKRPPKITRDQVLIFHHRQLVNAILTNATIRPHNDSWHMTPTSDFLDIVTLLTAPGTIEASVGALHWDSQVPAGYHEWLIVTPSSLRSAGAKHNAYRRDSGSYPASTSTRTVTMVPKLMAGDPEAKVTRGNITVARVVSRFAILGKSEWADLSLVGTSSGDETKLY